MKPKALIFDVYGTLFDVSAIARDCERVFPDHGERLGRLWRDKQLQYTWLRTLMGRYENFERVTLDALRAACLVLGLDPDRARDLPSAFARLRPFPEVEATLNALRSSGYGLRVLSNGTRAQLDALVAQGLPDVPLGVSTVDEVQAYKPDPKAYALGVRQAQVPIDQVLFVSSNAWDVAGASAFGLPCAWLNRFGGPMEELGVRPTMVAHDLRALATALGEGPPC